MEIVNILFRHANASKGYDFLDQHGLDEIISPIDLAIKKFDWSSDSKVFVRFY